MDVEVAADALEEMEPEAQVAVVNEMSDEAAVRPHRRDGARRRR